MANLPGAEALPHLDDAWRHLSGGARLDAVERAAPSLREHIAASGTVRAIRTFDIATVPYPARYAFFDRLALPLPFIWFTNRALYIEYTDRDGALRRLLANPTDPAGSRLAPFYAELLEKMPRAAERFMAKIRPPLREQLIAAGIDPASIDYLTFDHLHVQKLTPMLEEGGFYPRAKLLVTTEERRIAAKLHPLQREWYVDGVLAGVPEDRIVCFDRDLLLGDGLALVRTPGHTDGNHSIVFSVPGGLYTVSENGVAAECYAPLRSEIPGLRAYAQRSGAQVILNANTRERTLDQYTSMRLEALLAAPAHPGEMPRHFPSSELDRFPLAPGVRPTHAVVKVEHGDLAPRAEPAPRAASRPAAEAGLR